MAAKPRMLPSTTNYNADDAADAMPVDFLRVIQFKMR